MDNETIRSAIPPQFHERIFLVEDNEDDVKLTLEALKNSKLRVEIDVVPDGLSAIAFLHREGEYSNKHLLDLNLPLMTDGRY
jgi:chemotaxis family two-component system response regulator Rcp1